MIYSNVMKIISIPMLMLFMLLFASSAFGFGEIVGACEADCAKCHQLNIDEATDIVRKLNPDVNVLQVNSGPVRGLWELVIRAGGKKGLAYVDFSKQHVITGSIIKVDTRENITDKRAYELSKIDVSAVPLDEALVMGDEDARYRVIVFDDPD